MSHTPGILSMPFDEIPIIFRKNFHSTLKCSHTSVPARPRSFSCSHNDHRIFNIISYSINLVLMEVNAEMSHWGQTVFSLELVRCCHLFASVVPQLGKSMNILKLTGASAIS